MKIEDTNKFFQHPEEYFPKLNARENIKFPFSTKKKKRNFDQNRNKSTIIYDQFQW